MTRGKKPLHDHPTGIVDLPNLDKLNLNRGGSRSLLGVFPGDVPDLAEMAGIDEGSAEKLAEDLRLAISHHMARRRIQDDFDSLTAARRKLKLVRDKARKNFREDKQPGVLLNKLPRRCLDWLRAAGYRSPGPGTEPEVTAELIAQIERALAIGAGRANSRAPDTTLRLLVIDILHACRQAGVPVNMVSNRTGTDPDEQAVEESGFAAILRFVLDAAGEKIQLDNKERSRQDLYPLMRAAADIEKRSILSTPTALTPEEQAEYDAKLNELPEREEALAAMEKLLVLEAKTEARRKTDATQ